MSMITQEQIDRLKWFHDFDFPGGLHARSSDRASAAFYQLHRSFTSDKLQAVDFSGKTVIDVGCWDGYFSFLAEKRGAKSVLAVDDFTQNWGSAECFRIAKELYQSKVTLMSDLSVYDLSKRIDKTFDIILFMGVYYHLHSPFNAFAALRGLCHEQSIVIVQGDCVRNDQESYARFDLASTAACFIPTTRLLREMLQACYFEIDAPSYFGETPVLNDIKILAPLDLLNVAKRGVMEKQSAAIHHNPAEPTDRIFLVAKPFVGVNSFHVYEPPFGLRRFDTRGEFKMR